MAKAELASAGMIAYTKDFVPTTRPKAKEEIVKEEEPPPPPTFSEAELQAAKEEAYRKGFNDGEKTGKAYAHSDIAKTEQACMEIMPHLAAQIKTMASQYNQFVLEQKTLLPQLTLAIAQKILGDVPPEHLAEQISQKVIACVEAMLGEPEIHIYVHPQLSDVIESRLAKHFANSHEPGDVLIHADDAIPLTDCRVEWRNGGMTYSPGQALSKMQTIIDEMCQSVAHTHEEMTVPDVDVDINAAVKDAIDRQLAYDDIPPIPESAPEAEASASKDAATHNQPITPDDGGTHG